MLEDSKKYLVEFIGAFFLILTVGCTASLRGDGLMAPIAIGSALMIMVYAGGHISGGHYNPAVSLAAYMRGVISGQRCITYMIAQVLGGVAAAFIVNMLSDGPSAPSPLGYYFPVLILAEFLFTFALCYVVLLTATDEEVEGNSYYGLAIGFTVLTGAFAVGGSVCLGAFNPAVALSMTIMIGCCLKLAFVTIAANFIGAMVAAWIYRALKS